MSKQNYIWLMPNAIQRINNGELDEGLLSDKGNEFLEDAQCLSERYSVSIINEDALKWLLSYLDENRTCLSWEKEGGSGINGRLALIRENNDEKLYKFVEDTLLGGSGTSVIELCDIGLSLELIENLALYLLLFENANKNPTKEERIKRNEKIEELAPGFDMFSTCVLKCIEFTPDKTYVSNPQECLKHKRTALNNTIILLLAWRLHKALQQSEYHCPLNFRPLKSNPLAKLRKKV